MHARCKNSAAIETEPSESKNCPASFSVVVDGRARVCESFDVSKIAFDGIDDSDCYVYRKVAHETLKWFTGSGVKESIVSRTIDKLVGLAMDTTQTIFYRIFQTR